MIKSFLMIGQSNMGGRGFLHDVPPIYNERIQMLRNGRWQMMTEPINFDRPVSGVSLAASFGELWCFDNKEDSIGLIPCAEGGTTLEEWDVDGVLFRHAISEAKFAMETSEITGILWHHGESDSLGGNYKVYYDKLLKILNTVRKELNAPDIPIILGGLGDFLGKEGFGLECLEYELINDEIKRFAFEQDNCYFVTASGLTPNPDGIHIDALSLRKFGLRYYEAFSKKKHILESLSNEDELLNHINSREHTQKEKIFMVSRDLALGEISHKEFETRVMKLINN